MVLSAPSLWWPRLAAFVLAALAAASAAVWGLRVAAPVPASSIAAVAPPAVPPDAAAVARALGAASLADAPAAAQVAPVLESARFALLGVVAQPHAQGAALLSVDGKPAKPYVVGSNVVDGWTLQSVQGRRATLARNGAEMVLELPALVPAATMPAAAAPVAAAPTSKAPVAPVAMSMAAAVAAAQPAPGKAAEPGPAIALKGKMAP